MIQLKNKIKTALHNSPSVCAICRTIKRIPQYLDFIFMFGIWSSLALMIVAFAGLMFDVTIFHWNIPTLLYDWLGTRKDGGKYETLEFIGFGMGGMLATIGAIAFNRRAIAQIEASQAQTKHNELIEKRHINERLKSTIENLGHSDASVRIASFYQFYHLAKEGKEDFRHNIFQILCSRLCSMPNEISHMMERDGQKRPRTECQTLLDILFQSEGESVFGEFHADLRKAFLMYAGLTNANLVGAEFSGADLMAAFFQNANVSNASFSHANLPKANFENANLINTKFTGANLEEANLAGANFTHANFTSANLAYARIENADFTNADFLGAYFTDANLPFVHSIEGANFLWARIRDREISPEDLPTNKGKYLAPWTTDEFWAEVEKNEES